jgi:hypothetical protein
MTAHTPPPSLAGDLRALTASELSLPSRAGHVALLLSSAAMTTVVIALLLTEPALPLRATIGLSVGAAIGLSWVAFAAWVLARRRVLLGRHRIVAARMAVTFTSVFVAGALLIGYTTSNAAALGAAAFGVVMLAVAVGMLVKATRAFAELSKRRAVLERELGRSRS